MDDKNEDDATDNCLLDSALRYAELGYSVFPLLIGSKLPATNRGCLDATRDASLIEQTWGAASYNIGIATDGLLVVDIDGKSNPWLSSEDDADKALEISDCPIAITPRGGSHRYFKQPPADDGTYRNTASEIAPGVDTRADGGYVVAPSSNLTNGGGYRWLPSNDIVPVIDLPMPPDWLLENLQATKKTSRSSKKNANADDAKPADPIPSGQRNDTLARLGGALRRYNLDFATINAALQSHNITRCQPPLDCDEVEAIAASVSRYEADQISTGVIENAALKLTKRNTDKPFPSDLLRPPGFLTEIIDYNFAGANRKQPVLALGGALALMSTITGRAVQDELGTRTNLYILSVAGSGAGKERARDVNKDLLIEAGASNLLGPEAPASASGLVSAVNLNPVCLLQWDEIGRLLHSINGKHASPHLTGIITVLMKFFSSANSMFLGDAYADVKKNIVINQPHAVLHGTTVPKNLYENLTADSITDGFMGRLLVFESQDAAPDYQDPLLANLPPTDNLVATIQRWLAPRGGNLAAINPKPTIMAATPDAKAIWISLQQFCLDRERDTDDIYGSLWARCGEKARKLALMHACSREIQEVDEEAATWGRAVAEHLTSKLTIVGSRWIAESPYEDRCKRVMRYVEDRPGSRCGLSDLLRGPMRSMPRREREEVLNHMYDLGLLDTFSEQTNGRPRQIIRAPSGGIFATKNQPAGNLNGVL